MERASGMLQRIVVLLLVVLVLVGVWTFLHSGTKHSDPPPSTDAQAAFVSESALPAAARSAIDRIEAGGPFPSSADGTVYADGQHLLPSQPAGFYHRYSAGSGVIVQGQDDTLFYSADGGRTFRQVRR